ncbi:MAG: glycosyltransferase [Acidobacteriota bacterium]
MTRLLILGAAPLPFEPQRRQYAANLRTWHVTRPLLDDGHTVRLIGCRLPETYPADADPASLIERERLEYFSISGELFHDTGYVQKLCDEFEPEAILGVNTHPSSRAVLIDTDVPIWCDLNGWIMAEGQTKSYVYDDDRYLSHFWNMEREVLDRADFISTVSEAQANATVGELAVRGRLNSKNFGHEFVHRVPNAISEIDYQHSKNVVRGKVVPEDAFVVLWAGGYNTWTDVDLLYRALTTAMHRVDHLYFVSTGGAIEGHDEITFETFRRNAAEGEFADRFHFAGWVPTEDVPSYYFESNLGINVDSFNYETIFGARNRLNEMMKVGLAVLTTAGTEISNIIAAHGLGLTTATGDAEAFAEQLIWAARHPEKLAEMAAASKAFVHEEYSYERTTEPIRAWARSPTRAPDHGQRVEFGRFDFFSQPEPEAEEAREPAHTSAEATDAEISLDDLPEITRTRVHAVIPHHRGEAMLARCLRSLLASVSVELEIIVVTNHCQEPLPEIATTSEHVHVVTSEISLGFSAANNLGTEWARRELGDADFYYFVNNDTESTPDALVRLIAALEARPKAAMAGPKLLILDHDDHYNSLGINVTEDGWGWDEGIGLHVDDYGPVPALRPVITVTGSALLIDAGVHQAIGEWTEIYEYYFEDIDLGIKVWKQGREVIHVPEATVRHQISATMTDGSERKDFLFWRNRLFLATVHWPLGLWLRTLRRARSEIREPQRENRSVLQQALRETRQRLPALLRERWRRRGDTRWTRFLVPPGSTPVIRLPGAEDPEDAEDALTPAELAARESDLPSPGDYAGKPAVRSVVEHLTQTVAVTRAELAASRERADRLGAQYTEAMQVLNQIHSSKMWKLWSGFVAARRWLMKPLGFLRRS